MSSLEPTPFGKEMRKHFQFAESYVPINHGSFGTHPTYVQESHRRNQAELELRPDSYLRFGYASRLLESRKAVASLVNADVDDVVLVTNATTGYNTVLRSMVWQPGDVIVLFEIVYGSVMKTVEYIEETTPAQSAVLRELQFPISDDALLDGFTAAVQRINAEPGRRVRMAIFDTVSSMPGLRLPYERLTSRCRELNVLSLIDGAHGIGMLPLDLRALDPDFFVSNLHKWLFTPRGCALLYIPRRNQHLIRSPIPTSFLFQPRQDAATGQPLSATTAADSAPTFVELHNYVGTLDSQAYLTVPSALEFRSRVCGGEDAIMTYVDKLAREGGDLVAQLLGTEVMDAAGSRTRDCPFAMIRLPIEVGEGEGQVRASDGLLLYEYVRHWSVSETDTYFQALEWRGAWWIRLSGMVYLDLDDFRWVAGKIGQMCDVLRGPREGYVKDGTCRLCVEIAEGTRKPL